MQKARKIFAHGLARSHRLWYTVTKMKAAAQRGALMDRRPDMDALAAAKRRQYVKKEKRKHRILAALLTVTILAVWGIIIFALYSLWAPVSLPPVTEGTTESTPEITTARTSTGTVVTEAPRTQSLTLTADDVHRGDLILVSTLLERAYVFPKDESDLVTLYGNKSDSYRVSSSAIKLSRTTMAALDAMFDAFFAETGSRDYQITQGYRTLEEQTSIYDDYQESYGAEQGALLAALPGYSEHHTGMAIDMNVYTAAGVSYSLATAGDADPIYAWIYANAAKYGFVLRYPESKTTVTGITNEPWHFRYVGRGHAAYMAENSLTLEEYIALLYKHGASSPLHFTADGVSYTVFYVPLVGDETQIELPQNADFSISGDNDGGFIVTLRTAETNLE